MTSVPLPQQSKVFYGFNNIIQYICKTLFQYEKKKKNVVWLVGCLFVCRLRNAIRESRKVTERFRLSRVMLTG
jgi:hypothetical protein